MNRQDGYVVDVPYPLHFHKEMQPAWLAHVVTTLGCTAPDLSRPYVYGELGCGAGINLLVAAACNPLGRFIGIDFNRQHIEMARRTASEAGIGNIQFIEASFEDYHLGEVARFDFLASHGAWSWLPAKAQAGMLHLVHKALKPQGVLYLHYMCHPGATRLTAFQKVLLEMSRTGQGSSVEQVRHGMALLRRLADLDAGLFVDNPDMHRELAALEKEDPAYLAHDFLTEHWQPQHSADVHRLVAQTGADFIGSANAFENMDSLSVPADVQPLLPGLPSRAVRETVKDLARNQHQRMDIFQRAPQVLAGHAHLQAIGRSVFQALPSLPAPGALAFKTPIGEIPGPAALFAPLLAALQAGPQSFQALAAQAPFQQEPGLLLQALGMLMWADHAHPLRPEATPAPAAAALQAWLDAQRLPLQLVPACGAAVMR